MEKKLHKEQLAILTFIKVYLKKLSNKKIKIDQVPFADFVTWANCIGKQKIKLFQEKNFLNLDYLKIIILELWSIGKNYEFKLTKPPLLNKKRFNVVYSYCDKRDFKNDHFYDNYFGVKSNEIRNTYWFLISLDNYVPQKKFKNIIILCNKVSKFNFLTFLSFFFSTLKKKNSFYYFNNTYKLSKIYSNFFYNTFKKKNFTLFLPFENRPNQNAVIEKTKYISSSNLINAYYHRLPEPLQTEMLYKKNKIDNLYVSAKMQKDVFVKFFNWPKNKIKIINSLRYKDIRLRKNTIYLPYEINDEDFYLSRLKYLNKNILQLTRKFSISIHPLKYKSDIHSKLKNKIQKLINKKNLNKKDNISIILGETGSVAAECLETYGSVYHITNESFNIFSSDIWRDIKIIKIKEGIYLYKKKVDAKLVNTSNRKNPFKYLLRNF